MTEYVPHTQAAGEDLEKEDAKAAKAAIRNQRRQSSVAELSANGSNTSSPDEKRRRSLGQRASDQVDKIRKR